MLPAFKHPKQRHGELEWPILNLVKKRRMYFSSKDNLVLSCYVSQKLIGIKTSIDINDEFLVLPCHLLFFF